MFLFLFKNKLAQYNKMS